MDVHSILFYIFAAIAIFAAARVVTARNPVHSALYLVLTFFSAACIWMMLQAEFLSIALVLVYVGAVMVLFLFVVMMLDINIDKAGRGFFRSLPGVVVGVLIVLELALVLFRAFGGVRAMDAPPVPANYDNTKALGNLLYTEYVYPFEIAAVLLLVAIVAAIALTLRRRKDTRYNNPSAAVRTRSSDRLRVLNIAPVKRQAARPDAGEAK
ncbi:MAG: NADH-quinone oxidoreductase subunit J [Burkholderiaceae bacterium]|nr:NADH-quinone oxidoreductase subunit J [Burkholderiaceae bacterium]